MASGGPDWALYWPADLPYYQGVQQKKTRRVVLSLVGAGTLAAASVVSAQPNAAKPAAATPPVTPAPVAASHIDTKPGKLNVCEFRGLPLAVGNSWTYQATSLPTPELAANAEKAKRRVPLQVKKLVITVASSAVKPGITTVNLTEDSDGHVVNSTIECGAGKFDISPNSFFFAGEPDGYYHIDLADIARPAGTNWQVNAKGFSSQEWRDSLTATWKRTLTTGVTLPAGASPGSGKLETEHHYIIGVDETVGTPVGSYLAHRLNMEISGRVGVDGSKALADKPAEMPAGMVNTMWFVDNVGVVQVQNSYFQLYQLADAKLVK